MQVHYDRALTLCNSLAWAEMFIVFATVMRRFHTELFDTTRKEVDPKTDAFVPLPESDKGVRVLVKGAK